VKFDGSFTDTFRNVCKIYCYSAFRRAISVVYTLSIGDYFFSGHGVEGCFDSKRNKVKALGNCHIYLLTYLVRDSTLRVSLYPCYIRQFTPFTWWI